MTQGTIASRQNEDWNLTLLAAQRVLYSSAKTLRNWRFGLTGTIAVSGIAATTFFPDALTVIKALGAIMIPIERLMTTVEKGRIKSAASIQEQFDTRVLDLAWNDYRVGKPVDSEDISSAARQYKGPIQKQLRDWYTVEASDLRRPLNVLACQRINLGWDYKLRRSFAIFVAVIAVGIVLTILGIGFAKGLSLPDFALAYLPYLSFIFAASELAWSHFKHSQTQETHKNRVDADIDKEIRSAGTVSDDACRKIQDGIYDLRVAAPPVPDWWHGRTRIDYEANSRALVGYIASRVQAARR